MSRTTVADYMRDAVEMAGGRISESDYLASIQRMMNADGREQSITSLKTNAFNKKNMTKAEVTRVTIGDNKEVWLQENADTILSGGSVAPSNYTETKTVAPENMGTTDGHVWFGIPRRNTEGMDANAVAQIPQTQTGFMESESRELWRMATAYKMGKNVMMCGPKGCGKTIAVKELCHQVQTPMWRMTCSDGLTTDDLIGYMTSDGEKTIFIDGLVTSAVRHGGILFCDEFNFARASVLGVLHQVMDSGKLVIPMTGEILTAHDDFRVMAAINPPEDYEGTNEMNQATVDRYGVSLPFTYLNKEREVTCIMQQSGNHNRTLARQLVDFAGDLRRMKDDRSIQTDTSTRTLIDVMELATEWNITDAIEFSMIPKYGSYERKQIRLAGRARLSDYTPTIDD